MANKDYSVAMKNAEASVRMEGYKVTPHMREQCQQVLGGKLSTTEVLRQFTASKAARVRSNGI